MTALLELASALLAAAVGSELVLRGTKLQTGLGRVLVVWGGVYLAVLYPLVFLEHLDIVALTILWGGGFLSWFGVRSHVESSILLRMLYLLRQGPMTAPHVVTTYTSQYGRDARLRELVRGGLAHDHGGGMAVTPKGKAILAFVARLR